MRVGPRSAGADPGPACYGRGGTEPTVTDANLLLGYYDPGFFLGGRMALDRDAAGTALASVGAKLGLSAIETAWGIHRVVTESMAAAARIHIVEKGKDPRRYAMVGFGGAGPAMRPASRASGRDGTVDPARLRRRLGARLPGGPPVLRGCALPPAAARRAGRRRRHRRGAERARSRDPRRLLAAGVPDAEIVIERSADMRLFGQLHEINVPLPEGRIDDAAMPAIRAAFAAAYAARYTSVYEGVDVQMVSLRVRCRGSCRTDHHAGERRRRRSAQGRA